MSREVRRGALPEKQRIAEKCGVLAMEKWDYCAGRHNHVSGRAYVGFDLKLRPIKFNQRFAEDLLE